MVAAMIAVISRCFDELRHPLIIVGIGSDPSIGVAQNAAVLCMTTVMITAAVSFFLSFSFMHEAKKKELAKPRPLTRQVSDAAACQGYMGYISPTEQVSKPPAQILEPPMALPPPVISLESQMAHEAILPPWLACLQSFASPTLTCLSPTTSAQQPPCQPSRNRRPSLDEMFDDLEDEDERLRQAWVSQLSATKTNGGGVVYPPPSTPKVGVAPPVSTSDHAPGDLAAEITKPPSEPLLPKPPPISVPMSPKSVMSPAGLRSLGASPSGSRRPSGSSTSGDSATPASVTPASVTPERQCSEVRVVLPLVVTPIATCHVERRPGQLAFGLLRNTATGGEYGDNDDIPRLLRVWDAALELGEPMLVLYDFTSGHAPPFLLGGKLLQPCFRWANENARAWDTHVQGLAFVIPSPIVRRFLEMLTRMLAPPQPIRYCADLDEALIFLGGVRVARSYVKAAYKPV